MASAAGLVIPVESRNCSGPGCDLKAKMQCPTCIKLKIVEGSFFCSQECFKKNWGDHKALHKEAKALAKKAQEEGRAPLSDSCFPGFTFTGPLRAWAKSPYRPVPADIPRPDYADDGYPTSEAKMRGNNAIRTLSPEEIEQLRVTCRLGREVLDCAGRAIAPGVTTDEIDRVVHEACLERKCYPSPLNYHNFPKSCCTSVNEVICHGIPDHRPLEEGDVVNVDITVYYGGYHGDLNETFFVGKVDAESQRLVRAAYASLQAAIAICKPGTKYRDLGKVITQSVKPYNYGVVRAYCGHGIHSLFHTAPNVPHYHPNKAVGVMKVGHVFTIEPMINAGVYHDEHWGDNWTAVTRDGKRSAQFEHTMVVTETGVDILTKRLPTSPDGPVWFESVQPSPEVVPDADAKRRAIEKAVAAARAAKEKEASEKEASEKETAIEKGAS